MHPIVRYGTKGNDSFIPFLKISILINITKEKVIIKAIAPFSNPRKNPIADAIFISPPPILSSFKSAGIINGIGNNKNPLIDSAKLKLPKNEAPITIK